MEFIGKIIYQGDKRSGTNDKGEWEAQDFVAENTEGQVNEKLLFSVYGSERLKNFNIQMGETYVIEFNLNATKAKNGGWFQNNKAYKVTLK